MLDLLWLAHSSMFGDMWFETLDVKFGESKACRNRNRKYVESFVKFGESKLKY